MTTAVHGVSLDAGKETYTLRYSFNAICSAEQRAGRELTMMGDTNTQLPTLARLFIAGQLSTARILLWAGLQHGTDDITVERAGEIMHEYVQAGGTVPGLLAKIDEAMKVAGFATTAGLMGEALEEEEEEARKASVEDSVTSGN
tara:strand:- start:12969 stop:13400 length:432 start_codon:yes stop_codon:yes gene_type:complete